MGRLIDADKIPYESSEVTLSNWKCVTINIAYEGDIDAMETVDAEPVRHGKWKQVSERYVTSALRFYVCTACGEKSVGATRYCPHCGAKMDGEE